MQRNQTDRSRSRTPPSRKQNRRRSRTPPPRQLTPTPEPHADAGNIFIQIRRSRTTGHCITRCGGAAAVYALIDVWLMRHRNFSRSALTRLHQAPLVDRYAVVRGGLITDRRQDGILKARLARASGFRRNPRMLPAHTRWVHETFTEAFAQHLSLGPVEHRRERYHPHWDQQRVVLAVALDDLRVVANTVVQLATAAEQPGVTTVSEDTRDSEQ